MRTCKQDAEITSAEQLGAYKLATYHLSPQHLPSFANLSLSHLLGLLNEQRDTPAITDLLLFVFRNGQEGWQKCSLKEKKYLIQHKTFQTQLQNEFKVMSSKFEKSE